ncbi:MAG TPA: PadR family transcriptional regulator [Actinomycetota bacterium]|jgi:PadR family transcriptional regulator PadR|nr:PadR family transcriptional regulator [Actinomycetota bacterium]
MSGRQKRTQHTGQEGWAAQREFSRGALELAVLALIQGRPRYGYDLLTSLGEATDGFLAVKEGTVYPVLHRLEDAGYLSASWEAEGRGVPRKYYAITPAGSRRLAVLRSEWDRLVAGLGRLLEGGGT